MGAVEREEFYEAVKRLDAADEALRNKIDEVAGELRGEATAAVTALRGEQAAALAAAEERLSGGIRGVGAAVKDVRDALTWQNRTVAGAVLTGLIFFFVAYAEHLFGL